VRAAHEQSTQSLCDLRQRNWHANRYKKVRMKKAPPTDAEEITSYTLRQIPKTLWQKARIRAIQQDLDMRDVLFGLLRAFVAGKAEPKGE
jgi:hypothetical protein